VIADQVALQLLGLRVNAFGETFRCRPAVGDIVLDPEVALRSAGVVAGGENDAAIEFVFPDNDRDRGGRKQPLLGIMVWMASGLK